MELSSSSLFCALLLVIVNLVALTGSVSSRRKIIHHAEHSEMEPNSPDMVEEASNDPSSSLFSYSQAKNWKLNAANFGQITAVDINKKGNIVIFHRGNHVWNGRSFDGQNNYLQVDDGPIVLPTIVEIDTETGKIIDSWGQNLFYLPHGLSFDSKGFMWVTDVALHQVQKFGSSRTMPLFSIGQRFKPGSGKDHFCKPTSVAVDPATGEFYVADGYCNSRVVRFSEKGQFLSSFGTLPKSSPFPHDLAIPHKIVLIEKTKQACVADRENGRIVCYSYPGGEYQSLMTIEEFGGRLFSISYSKCNNGALFAVNGPTMYASEVPVKGFVLNSTTGHLISSFAPSTKETFSQPHDIVASDDCRYAFVVEIGPNNLYKFENANYMKLNPMTTTKSQSKTSQASSSELIPANQDRKMDSDLQVVETKPTSLNSTGDVPVADLSSSNLLSMGLLAVPLVCVLIYSSYLCCCRKDGRMSHFSPSNFNLFRKKRHDHFDLGRLLSDPEKSGFNRVAMDESDIDLEGQSDSEVEEFNIKSARKA